MKTIYLTSVHEEKLHETDSIIYLSTGEFIVIKGVNYTITWKEFDASDNIMTYHCS